MELEVDQVRADSPKLNFNWGRPTINLEWDMPNKKENKEALKELDDAILLFPDNFTIRKQR